MPRVVTAAAVVALGLGLAGTTQAQTTPQMAPSTAPLATMPNQAPSNPTMPSTANPSATGAPISGPSAANPPSANEPTNLSQQQIEQAQQALRLQGFYRGRIDGLIGPETQQAITQFQQSQGLQQTATLDQETMNRLLGGNAPSTAPTTGSTLQQRQPQPNAGQ
jgi:peptidoglycan hydrolase-like protein with peptidoglycan-binding domain